MSSNGLLAKPKWMNQEKYNDINKNIKDGEELIKELLDGWVVLKGASEGGNVARGDKSNLQFILTEDYLSDIERRENEKGRLSLNTTGMLPVDERGRLKCTKNGLDIPLSTIHDMLGTAEPRLNKKYNSPFFIGESEADKAFPPIFNRPEICIDKNILEPYEPFFKTFESLKDIPNAVLRGYSDNKNPIDTNNIELFAFDPVFMPANRTAILINYELIKYRINNKLKYNNKKGIKKGLTYAYYYKRKRRKILSDEFS